MGDHFAIPGPLSGRGQHQRYRDVFKPAIEAVSGLTAYRVDEDPTVEIGFEGIHAGIDIAAICFAEITLDNPNVWYELGYALARGKSVVLACSEERPSSYPFDVQHRGIISYTLDSKGAFEDLQGRITEKLTALLKKSAEMGNIETFVASRDGEGLSALEISALVTIAGQTEALDRNERVPSWHVKEAMDKAGFNEFGTAVAIRQLVVREMVRVFEDEDHNGNQYTTCTLDHAGIAWILANLDQLNLKRDPKPPPKPPTSSDDDFPF